MAGEGNPHVFLGLKREKVKCNELQIQIKQKQILRLEQSQDSKAINKAKKELEQMKYFVSESALGDLRKELSEKYKYTFTCHKNFKAWQDTILDSKESFNKDFDKSLRESFNNDFASLRQCYADITEPFFEWLEHIKKQNITNDISFTQFEKLFNEFIESKYSNLDSIEGFFWVWTL